MCIAWEPIYKELQAKIEACQKNCVGEQLKIECCFQACYDKWNELQLLVCQRGFTSAEEEIEFFKTIKPKFTGSLEYYTLRYQAELFKPAEDTASAVDFWAHEHARLRRFIETNQDFYTYYKEGRADLDSLYFLRINTTGATGPRPQVFGDQLISLCDGLVSTLQALEKYTVFIKKFVKEKL